MAALPIAHQTFHQGGRPALAPQLGSFGTHARGTKSHSVQVSHNAGSRPAWLNFCTTHPSTLRPPQPTYVPVGAPGQVRPTNVPQGSGHTGRPRQQRACGQHFTLPRDERRVPPIGSAHRGHAELRGPQRLQRQPLAQRDLARQHIVARGHEQHLHPSRHRLAHQRTRKQVAADDRTHAPTADVEHRRRGTRRESVIPNPERSTLDQRHQKALVPAGQHRPRRVHRDDRC